MFYMVGKSWVVLHYAFFKLLKIFVKFSKHNTKNPCLHDLRVITPNPALKIQTEICFFCQQLSMKVVSYQIVFFMLKTMLVQRFFFSL
jgi:hypothetical protein